MIDTTNLRRGPIALDVDEKALAAALGAGVRGEVRFDDGSRALYASDASNYRQVPIGVVLPRDKEDVVEAIGICRRFGAPIVGRGGGTSLAGQCCNAAVVLDFSRHVNRVLAIDVERRLAAVEPGAILDDLLAAAAAHGLTFGPDPASHSSCTLGGMIGNDSCGVHSVLAAFEGEGARTADNIEELEIATYDGVRMRVGRTSEEELARIIAQGGRRGQIYADLKALVLRHAERIRERFPNIPRRVSGYNLPYLLPENQFHVARALVGSEGTCVTVLEATAQLLSNPKARTLLVVGFEDVSVAADRVPQVLEHRPIGLEGIDDRLIEDEKAIGLYPRASALLPEGRGWLIVEFGGPSKEESDAKARRLIEQLPRLGAAGARLYEDPREVAQVWRARASALGATAHVPGKPLTWEGWEDSAVPPERLGAYLRDLRRLLEKHRFEGDFYGHFGQGCLHTRINFDLETKAGIEAFRAFLYEAADLVVSYGGSLSGEHGDGQSRAELLPRMFGPELIDAFRQFKRIWDPEGKMNPGKVVDAYSVTENLRLRAEDAPRPVGTHFRYPGDRGSFSRAVLRCVGVGACRRLSGGTMCPSFQVTREEEHSTRGRARLLFEMLRGETLRDGWRDGHVREALDLCLACKGCKADCPVGVDMATYKAEFLAHYYAGRLRPRSAYSMGLIHHWARLACLAPGIANFFTQTPAMAGILQALAGIAPERRLPPFARETFRKWFARRARPSRLPRERKRVLLWPDTFNDHFHPQTARAAVGVLEAAGFEVALPAESLCCGRPLYDFGMLDAAKRLLREILAALRREIRAGTPLVVLEPSCAAVFRDELVELFPDVEDARRLKEQTMLLSELLESRASGWSPGTLSGRAILQTHCHQKAVLTTEGDEKALARLGLEVSQPNDGCCGMAGAFGFERNHFDLSLAIGERAILPAVRAAEPEAVLVASGFSCREQIRQGTGRQALHLAEVLELALVAHARA
jgi:FAD/FMN-containing dehydrogenase/Fe-S oxidoreductase